MLCGWGFDANMNCDADNDSENQKYCTYTDFLNDARRMLADYVKLGHCEGCPFEATGEPFALTSWDPTSLADQMYQAMHESCATACD